MNVYTFNINPREGKPFDWLALSTNEFEAWDQLCKYIRFRFPANDATLVSMTKVQRYDFDTHETI